eukprot:664809-Prorocentrum_minimum.AAC.1
MVGRCILGLAASLDVSDGRFYCGELSTEGNLCTIRPMILLFPAVLTKATSEPSPLLSRTAYCTQRPQLLEPQDSWGATSQRSEFLLTH